MRQLKFDRLSLGELDLEENRELTYEMLKIEKPMPHRDRLYLNSSMYLTGAVICGRYWDRTSDPFHVKEVRYRCANRPFCKIKYTLN